MALTAASLINSGVLKSGSPKLRPIISSPLDFNSFAFAAIASVCEVARFLTLEDRNSFMIIIEIKIRSKN